LPALAAAALLATGCGAKQPQAPPALENKVASALEGIAEACGEAYRQAALPRFGAPSREPEETANMRALELAHVVRLNPGWIYQGEPLSEIVQLARERLRECGLDGAASHLAQLAGVPK
jgi:hypothetical protein